MRNTALRRILMGASIAFLAMGQAATAADDARYDVVGVESVQLSNAVQVTIETNGDANFNMDKWVDGNYYTDYSKSGSDYLVATKVIGMNLPKARSQVGDYVYIGKYPVSHLELLAPPEREMRHGSEVGPSLDVMVCLYTGAKMNLVEGLTSGGYLDSGMLADADQTFSVKFSQDHRSIIVTVISDQQKSTLERRQLEDVSDRDREMEVGLDNGLLNIRARNVHLTDLLSKVGEATGRHLRMDPAVERLVCAQVSGISVDDLVKRLAECYALEYSVSGDALVVSDVRTRTTSAYTSGVTYRLPVRQMKAENARELLPTFLMEYINVDKLKNELIVTGSQELAEKVRADLEVIDRPCPMVSVEAQMIEITSDAGADSSLRLAGSNGKFSWLFDGSAGDLTMTKLDVQASELKAQLDWLVKHNKVVVRSEANITTLSGETGQIFAGLSKFILVPAYRGTNEAVPVTAGTKLSITPRVGKDNITLSITSDMNEIEAVDAATNMPTVNSRTITGNFRVKPGETLLVGGLTQMQTHTSTRKIPLLGNLPVIGGLFRSRVRQQTKSDLVLLITPKII